MSQALIASMPPVLTIGFALVVALLAALLRRRLPAGVGEGALVTAVSGGALIGLAYSRQDYHWQPALIGHVLAGLAIVWYALGRVAARQPIGPDGRPAPTPASLDELGRASVFGQAGLVCALGALIWCCTAPGGLGSSAGWSPAASDFVALLVLSVFVWAFRTAGWAPYPALALLAWLLVENVPAVLVPEESPILLIAAGLLLALVVAALLLDWRRRTRRWPADPPPQPAARRPRAALVVLVTIGAVVVGLLATRTWDQRASGPALLLAALALLITGHWASRVRLGELGLALLAGGIIVTCTGWLPGPAWLRLSLGSGLASWYLLWLARFWNQQLDDGKPWTTAGRLIPAARRLSWVAAGLALVGCALSVHMLNGRAAPWVSLVAIAVLLAAMSQHVRDLAGGAGAALAACLTTAAASGPLLAVSLALFDAPATAVMELAAASTLLALRLVPAARPGDPARAVYRAYFGGVLPVAVLMTISHDGVGLGAWATLVLAGAAVVVGLGALRADPPGVAESSKPALGGPGGA